LDDQHEILADNEKVVKVKVVDYKKHIMNDCKQINDFMESLEIKGDIF
jgi:hypothetical protein